MEKDENFHFNRISDFFANKTILITGGTGFVGKALIEKLLRSCTNLKKIYVLTRPKYNLSGGERLEKMFAEPLFDILKQQHGEKIFEKVFSISSDVAAPDLGLSEEDRQKLISETEIIYHSAATVRFDVSLKFTTLLNIRGTKLLIELAKECKNLLVFSYISTTFCQERQKILEEKFYKPLISPHIVIGFCESLDEDVVRKIEKFFRGTSVNNYTFSKALSEALIEEKLEELPVIVQRPSIVTATWQEPIPGWIGNKAGISGLLIGAGKGVLRTMYGKSDNLMLDCCPVDDLVKSLILNTYHYHTYKNQRVYNLVGPQEILKRITFKTMIGIGQTICSREIPFNTALWYPNGALTGSRLHYYVDFVFTQLFPALILDALIFVAGRKPFLTKLQKRIWKECQLLEYYANREWKFESNIHDIQSLLNSEEFEAFGTNYDNFDVHNYFKDYVLGLRRYVLHEADEDIPRSLTRVKLLWYLDVICKILIVIGIWYYFMWVVIRYV